LDSIFKVRN